jgi:hypoxanthine phosphoribosyltransferase
MKLSESTKKLTRLIPEEAIREKILELGNSITSDYRDKLPLVIIAPLRGSFIFAADLVRAIDLPLRVDFMEVSSYGNEMHSSGNVKIHKDLRDDIAGCHVIIAEDIIDTGLTLNTLLAMLQTRNPASLEIASFLIKPHKHALSIKPKYIGFSIDDSFVVGYGLDYRGFLRNTSSIYSVSDPSVLEF